MALDNIQNKYIEGEGSPEGIVKGKKGFTYKDTLTNSEYESLGGDKWRLVKYEGNELIERSIEKRTDIVDVSDLQNTEEIYIKDIKTKYRLTDRKKDKIIRLSQGTGNSELIGLNTTKYNKAPYFKAGDFVEIEFNIPHQGNIISQGINIFGYSSQINGINIIVVEGSIPKIVMYHSDSLNPIFAYTVYDSNGSIHNSDEISYDTWYTIKIVYQKDITSTTYHVGIFNKFIVSGWDLLLKRVSITSLTEGTDNYYGSNFDGTDIIGDDGVSKLIPVVHSNTATELPTPTPLDEIIDSQNRVLKVVVKDNIITPQMVGYNTELNTDLNFTNCAADFIQFCIDSPYAVEIPPGNYYLSKTVHINKSKHIKMFGNNKRLYGDNKTTTAFYSDKNIEFFRVSGMNTVIDGCGVVFFDLIENIKNPVAWSIGAIDERDSLITFYVFLKQVTVHGNQRKLLQGANIGGYGVKFNTDPEIFNERPYEMNGIYISDVDFEALNIGLYSPHVSPAYSNAGGWFNTFNISGRVTNCKQALVLHSGSLAEIHLMGQDNPVLLESEKDKYFFYIGTGKITYDVMAFDILPRPNEDPKNYYRHRNITYSVNPENIAISRSYNNWRDNLFVPDNVNWNTIVRDSHLLAITGKPENATVLTNQVAFAGHDDRFSYKGYVLPDPINLFPLDNSASDTDANSISGFIQGVGSGSINITSEEEIIDGNSERFLKIESNTTDESYAEYTLSNLVIGKKYKVRFDNISDMPYTKLLITGSKKEIEDIYTETEWVKREYEIEAISNEIVFKFYSTIGRTSIYTGVNEIHVQDTFIRGRDYVITVTDGITTHEVNFTPSNTFPDTFGLNNVSYNDYYELTQLFGLISNITVNRNQMDTINYKVQDEFGSNPVTITTRLIGIEGSSLGIKNLEVIDYWEDNNLHPSEDSLNFSPLTEDVSALTLYNKDLLKSLNASGRNYHNLNNNKGFAEIIIPVQELPKKLRRLLINFRSACPERVQAIFYNSITNEISRVSTKAEEIQVDSTLDMMDPTGISAINNSYSDTVILRLFGLKPNQRGYTNISLVDVVVTSSENETVPVITKQGGTINNKGNLVMMTPISDGAKSYLEDVYFGFNDDVSNFNFTKYRPTILLNNTSGVQKNLSFDTKGIDSNTNLHFDKNAGSEYIIYAFKESKPFNAPAYSDSSDILINNDENGISTKDGSPLVLKSGEWIKVKLIKKNNTNTIDYVFVELDRSNPQSYSFFPTVVNIEGLNTKVEASIGTVIPLNTVGGTFANMASANTNKTFTTTGNVLNAFAEVLVNRVDQPEITGATYKASKGVPFVPSTNMIMRVENKGVPRGVVYWFEEV